MYPPANHSRTLFFGRVMDLATFHWSIAGPYIFFNLTVVATQSIKRHCHKSVKALEIRFI